MAERFGTDDVEGMTLGEWWAIADEVDARVEDRMALDWDQEVARARLMLEPARPAACSCQHKVVGRYRDGHLDRIPTEHRCSVHG